MFVISDQKINDAFVCKRLHQLWFLDYEMLIAEFLEKAKIIPLRTFRLHFVSLTEPE